MEYNEAKREFLQTWGKLGSEWGISRTMAQVHALLLISPKALSTEEVMEELNISRGNANMNLRELLTWNLLYKELIPGDRKEYFKAEKDIWEIARRVTMERKRRELDPVQKTLGILKDIPADDAGEEGKEFVKVVGELNSFLGKMDKFSEMILGEKSNWFFENVLKVIK